MRTNRKNGKFIKKDPNKFEINENVVTLFVGKEKTIIDLEDLPAVEILFWRYNKGSKSVCSQMKMGSKYKNVLIYRLILNLLDSKLQVDHINGNRLDNRKCNLRIATQKQNVFNSAKKKNSKSSFKGVTPERGKWKAAIEINGKNINLGRFDKEEMPELRIKKRL